MRQRVDYTGKQFGRLTVTEEAPNKGKRTCWSCQCICGSVCIISTDELRSGDSESCGCLKKELIFEDITNKKFGFLTALECLYTKKSSTTYMWKCLCDCGNICEVDGKNLRISHTKSCGCYKPDNVKLHEATKRFYENIEKTDTCWNWKGLYWNGYGVLFYKKQITAHRFSYMIHKGSLEKGKCICHTCDNPKCVNPEHLYQGSFKDNAKDASDRGRLRHGEKHHKSKLTEDDVRYILTSTEKGIDLAKKYGVTKTQISLIRTRKSWLKIKQ